ncbi:MAG: helix-hairpin-helix domain-containing protein, partial [Chloroflexota bacterium]|nr:helix-hairpin-helix domain-containing protein [Chloroflexota bacterium]
ENTADLTPGDILEGFVSQFYDDAAYVPPKLVLQEEVSDAEVIQSWLREKRGNKVSLTVPRRGDKRDLIEMAARNAMETLEQYRLRWLSDEQKSIAALTELQEALHLPVWPQRIECYDVAHLQGTDVAGAMVVFEKGTPKKKEYRRFQLKTTGNNDYASMQEMLRRRFKRASVVQVESERQQAMQVARGGERGEPAPSADFEAAMRLQEDRQEELSGNGASPNGNTDKESAWAVLPDLLVIDGGKGQLSAAYEVLKEAGLTDVPIISLAKREEEVFLPGKSEPVILTFRSEGLRLLQRVRDEAHRFSNSYNRKLGSKRGTHSKLDDVPDIGPVRKKALLRQFGSVKAMREATLEELIAVKGMDKRSALSIKENL